MLYEQYSGAAPPNHLRQRTRTRKYAETGTPSLIIDASMAVLAARGVEAQGLAR